MDKREEFEYMESGDPVVDLDRLVDLLIEQYDMKNERGDETLRNLQQDIMTAGSR